MKRKKPLKKVLHGVGLAIAERRRELFLTQDEFAQKCNIHPSYLSDLERGKRNVSLAVLLEISHALDMRFAELLDIAEGNGG